MSIISQREKPIGIFDSGIGGLTVANAIHALLPQENLIYFGDTAHLPYGDKSADAIRYYCLKIGKFLLEQDCKMIVVACNSASTAGYNVLLEFFREHALFVNVVDPLVEAVASHGFSKVGVIATKATIHSAVYPNQLHRLKPQLEVASLATPLLAPMIEEGFVKNRISRVVLDTYLNDPAIKNINALILACTHYPLIRPVLEEFYAGQVQIFDSTYVVAEAVKQRLTEAGWLNDSSQQPVHRFCVSDYTTSFEAATRLFYSEAITLEHQPIW